MAGTGPQGFALLPLLAGLVLVPTAAEAAAAPCSAAWGAVSCTGRVTHQGHAPSACAKQQTIRIMYRKADWAGVGAVRGLACTGAGPATGGAGCLPLPYLPEPAVHGIMPSAFALKAP